MKNFVVYKHTFPNGKVYIGITCTNPKDRWRSGHGYNNQPVMKNAIVKYGWANISHEIIAENLSKEAACAFEVELIKAYRSTERAYGYNVTGGGEHYEMTEEHKRKISIANRGKVSHLRGIPMTDSRKQKIGIANKGKKRTDEQRQRQSEYMKTHAIGGNNPRSRSVRCVETGEVFATVKIAAEWVKVARSTLSDALNGRTESCRGYHWVYEKKNQ